MLASHLRESENHEIISQYTLNQTLWDCSHGFSGRWGMGTGVDMETKTLSRIN